MILLGIMMPGMDGGNEVSRRLKSAVYLSKYKEPPLCGNK
jgi:CheY-like chemotaxis protein